MRDVNAAWLLLADPRSRRAWDASHAAPGVPGMPSGPGTTAWDVTTVPAWRRPTLSPRNGNGGWVALSVVIAVLIVVLVGGVVAAAMQPDLPGSNSPGYRSNLGH